MMNIDKYTDAIRNCRFCFMCRHISPVANVTFAEADTPRVRAVMIYGATMHPEWWSNPDYIAMLYRSDLSRCCTRHCVNHFDENSLNIAARTDIVEMGYVPENIKAIRDELVAGADWQVSGKADVLYFADPYSTEAGTDKVFAEIMKKAGIGFATVSGCGCIGRALKVLGFADDAKAAMTKFAGVINASGAKSVVVSNPAAYHALKVDAAEWGIEINAEVMHTGEYFLSCGLNISKQAGKLYYIESDYLRNYNELTFPHELLAKLGAEEQHLGASCDFLDVPDQQESFTCGEGAVVLPRIDAALVEKLAKRVVDQVDDPENDRVVTASAYTKIALERYTSLKVETLEELVLKSL